MSKTVEEALKQATFYSDDQLYVFLKLPAGAITVAAGIIAEISEPFCALIVDKDEVSLLIPEEALEDFKGRLRDYQGADKRYRLITVDVELPMEMVGFMARLSQKLAEAGVSILPYAAYSRDHIVVDDQHFDNALQALHALQSDI